MLVDTRIEQVDQTDSAALHDWFVARDRAWRADLGGDEPLWLEPELTVRLAGTDDDYVVLVARDDAGAVVGTGFVELPLRDNTGTASIEATVVPERRREGLGSALVDEMVRLAADGGRPKLITETSYDIDGTPDASVPFATRHGFVEKLVEVRRDLALPVDETLLDELEATARKRADGYELVPFHGRPPAHLLQARADLARRISTDAPLGDLDWEEENWDEGRVLRSYDMAVDMQRELWGVLAIAPDGTAAGVSELAASSLEPHRAYQWDTVVERGHRGHGLGMLMKVANHRALADGWPQARVMHTWNAASNTHMIAVNEALGYRPAKLNAEWGRDIG